MSRIIPVLLWDEHGCVKGRQFNPGRRIGSIADRVRLLQARNIDELIILDIAATPNNRWPRFDQIKELTQDLFMPVTIGGGIKTLGDVDRLLRSGADKVAICTAALENPKLIEESSHRFGSQAVVASIDVRCGRVHTRCGRTDTLLDPVQWAGTLERAGAGEILLNCVERDGVLGGYDLDLIAAVSAAVDIPVIAAGGCGSYEHLAEAFHAGAHAVAVGAAFQFCDLTPKGAARYLDQQGFAVRL